MALQDALSGLGIEANEFSSLFWNSIPPEILDKINLMLNLGTAVLIIVLVYFSIVFIIKIIRLIIGSREARRLKDIREILEGLDKKMEELLGLIKSKIEKKKPDKKK